MIVFLMLTVAQPKAIIVVLLPGRNKTQNDSQFLWCPRSPVGNIELKYCPAENVTQLKV